MSRPGDWNCRSCQYLNFQRRDSCQRCGEPKIGGGDFVNFGSRKSTSGITGPDVRLGDWYCTVGNCGGHNFANRSSCFKCGAFKENCSSSGGGSGSSRSGWKSGDWICNWPGCNEHNFANRMECFRCNAPRDSATRRN